MSDWLNFAVLLEKKLQSGNCSIQIGKILLEQHSWGDAARALNNGIAKGNLEDPNEASALLMTCHGMMNGSGQLESSWRKDSDGDGYR